MKIAVVRIGGHQAIVKEGEQIEVDKLNAKVGDTVEFETLLVSGEDGSDFSIGAPVLKGVTVSAKVLEHGKNSKIRIFKMKPRKRYRRTYGHRQHFTAIEIVSIGGKSKAKAPAAKKAATPKKEKAAAKPKKVADKTEK